MSAEVRGAASPRGEAGTTVLSLLRAAARGVRGDPWGENGDPEVAQARAAACWRIAETAHLFLRTQPSAVVFVSPHWIPR